MASFKISILHNFFPQKLDFIFNYLADNRIETYLYLKIWK